MRPRYLLLSLLSGFFLLASTHEAGADRISDILDSVKGGGRAKTRTAVSIVRKSNGLMPDDSHASENSNWIDVTDQFRQAGKNRKATFGPSSTIHIRNSPLAE
jgi:hypothetical protein